MTTPAVLGERVLRRLGVEIVPVASRPALSVTISVRSIAEQALQALGVTVTQANRPALTTVVTMQSIADAALQAVGVTVPAAHQPPVTGPPATTTNIAGAALIELGVVASDETPAASDLTVALEHATSVHASLVGQGIASWSDSTIPDQLIEEYVKLTALVTASSFGKTGDPAQWAPLEARVRKYSQVHESQGAVILASVASVHASLVSAGMASWASTAIPQAAFDEYVALTTAQIAPVFGVAVDPATLPLIEARVKRIALILQSQSLAEASVAALHDELVGNAVVSWALNAIPQAVSDDYAGLTSIRLAPLFGVKADDAGVKDMEARIRKFSMVQRAPDLATEAVMAVHADLGARDKLRWTVWDIPQAAEQPYILLAAFRLGPEFDRQVAPSDVIQAEHAIARMIALPTSGERVRAQYF
jgi:hypothetical protein